MSMIWSPLHIKIHESGNTLTPTCSSISLSSPFACVLYSSWCLCEPGCNVTASFWLKFVSKASLHSELLVFCLEQQSCRWKKSVLICRAVTLTVLNSLVSVPIHSCLSLFTKRRYERLDQFWFYCAIVIAPAESDTVPLVPWMFGACHLACSRISQMLVKCYHKAFFCMEAAPFVCPLQPVCFCLGCHDCLCKATVQLCAPVGFLCKSYRAHWSVNLQHAKQNSWEHAALCNLVTPPRLRVPIWFCLMF